MNHYITHKPVVLAHRGDSARYPENTMPAFESAVKMKVDVIETDVHLTADEQVIIWHDETLERMSGDPRCISQLTWSEIQKVNAGSFFSTDGGKTFPFKDKNITPVLLEELIQKFPRMRFNVDLKDNNLLLTEKYAEILEKNNCQSRVVTASFHKKVLHYFRKLLPEAMTSCTSFEVMRLILLFRSGLLALPFPYKKRILQVPEYSGKIKVLSHGFIKYLHKRGLKVQVWTVNDYDEMNRFLDMGVDGIFTDRPALLQDVLQKRENIKT
ncbi:MAG: glycerophosphodiester phosphodiesterase [Spirochaetaceae bacterium]|nr:glycerophosphodiester phosphodiesterase [Spirochaetaceae bacterium]